MQLWNVKVQLEDTPPSLFFPTVGKPHFFNAISLHMKTPKLDLVGGAEDVIISEWMGFYLVHESMLLGAGTFQGVSNLLIG